MHDRSSINTSKTTSRFYAQWICCLSHFAEFSNHQNPLPHVLFLRNYDGIFIRITSKMKGKTVGRKKKRNRNFVRSLLGLKVLWALSLTFISQWFHHWPRWLHHCFRNRWKGTTIVGSFPILLCITNGGMLFTTPLCVVQPRRPRRLIDCLTSIFSGWGGSG